MGTLLLSSAGFNKLGFRPELSCCFRDGRGGELKGSRARMRCTIGEPARLDVQALQGCGVTAYFLMHIIKNCYFQLNSTKGHQRSDLIPTVSFCTRLD